MLSTVFEIQEGRTDRTSGAADIDVSDAKVIVFDSDVQVYFGTSSTKYLDVVAWYPLGVRMVSSIHVDSATGYALM